MTFRDALNDTKPLYRLYYKGMRLLDHDLIGDGQFVLLTLALPIRGKNPCYQEVLNVDHNYSDVDMHFVDMLEPLN